MKPTISTIPPFDRQVKALNKKSESNNITDKQIQNALKEV